MKIKDILSKKETLSFEVFPPRREGEFESLVSTIHDLKKYNPDWISVTYGAGGSTKSRTAEIASMIKCFFDLEVLAHLTCVNATKKDIGNILYEFKMRHIENILALRGDLPNGEKINELDGFQYANELVSFIKKKNGFCVGAACYPQGHVESQSLKGDIENLKRKVDSGVDFLITQLFFENGKFYDFLERAEKAGITIPIIPGIMPITNYHQISKITKLSGQEIPPVLRRRLEKIVDKPDEVEKYGKDYAAMQIMDLRMNKSNGIHLYCMNKSEIVSNILDAVGYK